MLIIDEQFITYLYAVFTSFTMSNRDIEGVINAWLNGDEVAFNRIIDYYYRLLMRSSLHMGQSREDAEELVMNVLLKVWQNKHRLHEVLQFDDYLFGILRREIVLLSRKQILKTEDIEAFSARNLDTTEQQDLSFKELQEMYQAALDKLTPKQREVFLSIRENDISRKELAEKTGMSLNTINSHMKSAHKLLRAELRDYYEISILIFLLNVNLLLIA